MLCTACRAAVRLLVSLITLTSLAAPSTQQNQPIPDIATLMHQVQQHQRDLEKTRDSYAFRERQTIEELDKNGSVKKTETRELQVFFVNSHQIERLVGKSGAPLSPSDEAKEAERVKREIEKAEKTPPGQMTDSNGQPSVGRMLAIERFSNGRRVMMDNRSMLAFDFVGDPDAKTHGIAEDACKRLSGTIWIDEQDRQVRRVEARLNDGYKMGFGLFALSKGSSFVFDQKLVNNELWLPTSTTIHVEARAAGFLNYRANIHMVDDEYRRFVASAEQKDGTPATR
jgi:hypothetical protein